MRFSLRGALRGLARGLKSIGKFAIVAAIYPIRQFYNTYYGAYLAKKNQSRPPMPPPPKFVKSLSNLGSRVSSAVSDLLQSIRTKIKGPLPAGAGGKSNNNNNNNNSNKNSQPVQQKAQQQQRTPVNTVRMPFVSSSSSPSQATGTVSKMQAGDLSKTFANVSGPNTATPAAAPTTPKVGARTAPASRSRVAALT